MSMNGPSPYAVRVLRSLLQKPKRLPQIVMDTKLDQRTVQAQITALLRDEAIRVEARVMVNNFGGPWAVYAPNVVRI